MTDQPLTGRLLVATPALRDGNFAHTVVLVVDHADHGALGVVLNRPSDIPVHAALPDWQAAAADPAVVFVGGPVENDAMLALARAEGDADGLRPIMAGVAVVDLSAPPSLLQVNAIRLFAGYAGWGTSQLEGEIAAGGWFVVEADADDPFTSQPAALWRTVLRRQGGFFRTISERPSLN